MKIIILNKYREKPIFTNKSYYVSSNDLESDSGYDPNFYGNISKLIRILNKGGFNDETLGVIWNNASFSFLTNEMDANYDNFKLSDKIDFIIPKFNHLINLDSNNAVATVRDEMFYYLKFNLSEKAKLKTEEQEKLNRLLNKIVDIVGSSLNEREKQTFETSTHILFKSNFITNRQMFFNYLIWLKGILGNVECSNEWKEIKEWKKIPVAHKRIGEILFNRLLTLFIVDKKVAMSD